MCGLLRLNIKLELTLAQFSSCEMSASRLCELCSTIDFTRYAWRNELRNVESYSTIVDSVMDGKESKYVVESDTLKQELGTLHDISKRAAQCDLCRIVTRKLREEGYLRPRRHNNGSSHSERCFIQCASFCSSQAGPKGSPHDTRNFHYGGIRSRKARIPASKYTTMKFVVFIKFRRDFFEEILAFQSCSPWIPTVMDTITGIMPTDPSVASFSGRILDPVKADLRLFKFWLDHCESRHGDSCCSLPLMEHLGRPTGLLLIDVKDSCIVNAPDACPYVALSYVWGKCNSYKLTKADLPSTRQKRGLLRKALPATVRDAITVTLGVGLRYLWVDAICIVQDDRAHLQSQIKQMASVYANAACTIIAAAGDDADYGLPGVRAGTRLLRQDVLKVSGTTLMSAIGSGCREEAVLRKQSTYAPAEDNIPYSPWVSRRDTNT